MAKQKTYSSKRITLRALTVRDLKAFSEAQKNLHPKLGKWDHPPMPEEHLTKAKFSERIRHYKMRAKEDDLYIWSLFSKKTGEILGWIDVSTICRGTYQMANLGYYIFNNQRGHGYSIEALKALIPFLFEDLKYHRLEAMTDLDNEASIKTAERCGLYPEGIKKHYWQDEAGVWQDQMVFIATPELYKSRRVKSI